MSITGKIVGIVGLLLMAWPIVVYFFGLACGAISMQYNDPDMKFMGKDAGFYMVLGLVGGMVWFPIILILYVVAS